ncbi:MAG TPA: DUF6457 domain-containing protein [Acidimicrobiales bacterium]|nr:DUF6457 domain-containing protein [Acidimicrobiales bacterium]
MTPTDRDWLRRFAAELGVREPTEDEIQSLLALAATAAHASERTAAPLTCWLVGVAGTDPAEAHATAERLAAELGS